MTRDAKKISNIASFDYEDPAKTGRWATLVDGDFRVILTEWPATLLSMFRAGVLRGKAKEDAELLMEISSLPSDSSALP